MAPLSTYEEFRRAVSDLNFAARIDLRELWAAVNGDIFALQELIPELLRTYGEASAVYGADSGPEGAGHERTSRLGNVRGADRGVVPISR